MKVVNKTSKLANSVSTEMNSLWLTMSKAKGRSVQSQDAQAGKVA